MQKRYSGEREMIPEIGQFALVLALAIAIVQSILPIVGASMGRLLWMESAKTTHDARPKA